MTFTWRSLCGPDPNPMTVAEGEALQKLVWMLSSDPFIVQIGAERGASTCAMVTAQPFAKIYSIDIGKHPEEFDNLKKCGFPFCGVSRVLGRSEDIGKTWEWDKCDMLFIDGDHRYEGVKGDIEAWVPHHIKPGGILAFHDYIPHPIPPHIKGRVVDAVDEMQDKYHFEEILRCERLIAFRMPLQS